MSDYSFYEGRRRLIQVVGAVGITTVDLAPAAGDEWTIVWAYGVHNDAAARAMGWSFTDSNPDNPVTPLTITFPTSSQVGGITMDILNFRPIGGTATVLPLAVPVVLDKYIKATFNVAAIDAAKQITVNALILERLGVQVP